MKKLILLVLFLPRIAAAASHHEPDSVYLFSYARNSSSGLHFAWSLDGERWHDIGNGYGYLKSDYGRWGTEKRVNTPYLLKTPDGLWHCVWSVNERENAFAHASSADLVYWGRQSYPFIKEGNNFLRPVVRYADDTYIIDYNSTNGKYYRISTKDFRNCTPAAEIPASQYANTSITVNLPSGAASGQVHKVAWEVVETLVRAYELKQYRNGLYSETTKEDPQRFAGLKPVSAHITLHPEKPLPISDMLIGVFFEDLNYAADGGLYAELVQNRGFEYAPGDKEGRDESWNSKHSWSLQGGQGTFTIDSASPIHPNNPHYAVLDISTTGAALFNSGFDGIALQKGEKYDFSIHTKDAGTKLLVRLTDRRGKVLAQTTVNTSTEGWETSRAVLKATSDASDARLELHPLSKGRLCLDMVSLFPQNTFKGRKNGLRADLAQAIAGIRPRFVRFPGGCVAHGDGLNNIYRWKNTIGPPEARKPQRNLWGYHQSAGLGYFEYFQFCEDIGAVPVPVIAAGVPCQNSATGGGGQQGGIPLEEMGTYIQDIIDLVEYANGNVHTKWGKKRAEAGHPEPFNLQYIGIGNEDLISDVFEERFTMIYEAMKKAHPEITIIGTTGPFYEGTDYDEGWKIANRLKVPMVDEHYYQPPGWFIHNQDFYDKYDRTRSKVYLGEYAAHLPGRPNNLETALSEALYLTSLERNGDVVRMASYAPLLAKEGHTQWNPDLIYFNNTEVKTTVGYEVQKLYGHNAGQEYLPSAISLSATEDAVKKRIAVSAVRDTASKDLIVKLVNLLPVVVNTTLDLKGLVTAGTEGERTVLQGKPDARDVRPVKGTCRVDGKLNMELPAYSFTVIRLKTQ